MKFCHNTNFTFPEQSQRSRSVFQDGSKSLGLFWKENNPSYNRRNMVHVLRNLKTVIKIHKTGICFTNFK